MPKATVSNEAKRVELKSLEGAFVVVKQLAHGQRLHRSDISARLSFEQQTANRVRNGMGASELNDDPARTEVELMQLHARQYEYTHMIVEHNLEEDDGRPMNFRDVSTFDRLASHIGDEIDQILDDCNANKLDKENFQQPSELASTVEDT